MEPKFNIAMLIDADNSPAAMIDEVLAELANHGVINIRRAYGNWKSPHLIGWENVLHENAIQPVQQFAYSKGKNASDMAMTIDAMDLIHTLPVNGVCLVSSDADFTPLAMRIKAAGLWVYGFGEKKTPAPFVAACSTFVYLENLVQTAPPALAALDKSGAAAQAKAPQAKKSAKELKGDSGLVKLLRDSVAACADEEGWAFLGRVGQHIAQRRSFDSRNYGYAKLKDLFEAIDLFHIALRNKQHYLRDKRLGPATPLSETTPL